MHHLHPSQAISSGEHQIRCASKRKPLFPRELSRATGKQGKSGLGIETQRQAVANYLNGGNWRIIAEFTEIESSKRADRPELDKALAAARARRVPLVVAKVDRLTRSVSFLSLGCLTPGSMSGCRSAGA
jgi:hypothetical protein